MAMLVYQRVILRYQEIHSSLNPGTAEVGGRPLCQTQPRLTFFFAGQNWSRKEQLRWVMESDKMGSLNITMGSLVIVSSSKKDNQTIASLRLRKSRESKIKSGPSWLLALPKGTRWRCLERRTPPTSIGETPGAPSLGVVEASGSSVESEIGSGMSRGMRLLGWYTFTFKI